MEIDQERETILVVDDELAIRAIVRVVLEQAGTPLLPLSMEKTASASIDQADRGFQIKWLAKSAAALNLQLNPLADVVG